MSPLPSSFLLLFIFLVLYSAAAATREEWERGFFVVSKGHNVERGDGNYDSTGLFRELYIVHVHKQRPWR
jgi:hypothetical protein